MACLVSLKSPPSSHSLCVTVTIYPAHLLDIAVVFSFGVILMVNTSLLSGAALKCEASSVVMSLLDKITTCNLAIGNTVPRCQFDWSSQQPRRPEKLIDLCSSFCSTVRVRCFYGYTMKTDERGKEKRVEEDNWERKKSLSNSSRGRV